MLNVGAGAGAYEPAGRDVVAVEPSSLLIAQRPPGDSGRRDTRSRNPIRLEDRGMIGGPVTLVAGAVILLAIFR